MPTSLFHVAIGLLIGIAILGDEWDKRALSAITVVVLLPDLDSVLSLWFPGAHRSYLHNVFVFLVPAAALLTLQGFGRLKRFQGRWPNAIKVCWVALLTLAVAGIGLDAVASGVNLFFPVHDQYYQLQGNVMYSSQHGLKQTLTDVERTKLGSTQTVYYASGIDPVPGPEPQRVERTFPIFENTLQLMLSLTVFGIVGYRMQRRKGLQMHRFFPVTPVRQTMKKE